LIVLSPAASWWTMMPIQLIAYTVTGCIFCCPRSEVCSPGAPHSGAQSLAAGILIAGMPSFYIPRSLVLGLPMLVATVAWIFGSKEGEAKILALSSARLVAMVFAAGAPLKPRRNIITAGIRLSRLTQVCRCGPALQYALRRSGLGALRK
jgi:hypothetical protein